MSLNVILKLLRIDHQDLTCKIISENLGILEDWQKEVSEEALESEDSAEQSQKPSRSPLRSIDTGKAYIGSSNKARSIEDFQEQHSDDSAFFRFRSRFTAFLRETVPSSNDRPWTPMPEHKVSHIHISLARSSIIA